MASNTSPPPGWAGDEPVRVVPYDPGWPRGFEAMRGELEPLLAPWLTGGIHHIGSTAVPGLAAKPTVDIAAGVSSLEASRAAIALLQAHGWWYAPYRPEEMHWFCRPSPLRREFHLHLIRTGSPTLRDRLAFRDALRSDAALRRRYAALKRRLAGRHPGDREAYTDAKAAFITAALAAMPEVAPPQST